MLHHSETISSGHMSELNRMLQRLVKGEPIQHILGYTEFGGLELKVTRDVLIPRPETEELVLWILETMRGNDPVTVQDHGSAQDPLICDIGTGSGCIALALKKELPGSEIVGTDIFPLALELARENAALHSLEVQFLLHDILTQEWPEEYSSPDIVVSNPPYIPVRERRDLEIRVSEFEPEMALFVPDDDPLIYYRDIAQKAFQRLKHNGRIFFEIHETFASQISELMDELGFTSVVVKKDINGKNRMIRAIKK